MGNDEPIDYGIVASGSTAGNFSIRDARKMAQDQLAKAPSVMAGIDDSYQLERYQDADTVDLSQGKERFRTRFAGIDAPEMGQGELGVKAMQYLKSISQDAPKITVKNTIKDSKGRNVSFLYAGDKNLNVELVRGGYAKVYDQYLNSVPTKIRDELTQAQKEAQEAQIGIWSPDANYEDSQDWRQRMGREGAFMGHTVEPLKNPETMSIRDARRMAQKELGQLDPKLGSANRTRDFGGKQGAPISGSDRYGKADGWLERVTNALDYAGNISRSAFKGAAEGGKQSVWKVLPTAAIYAEQAAQKKRKTTSTDLKDTYTKLVGLGKLRMGKDDGEFDIGDMGDFAADVAIDIFTDPLTYMSFGLSKLAQGGSKLAKTFPAAHKGIIDSRLGEATKAAKNYGRFKTGAQAALGATYGYGAVDEDATTLQKFGATAAGAITGATIGPAIGGMSRFGKGVADSLSSKYAVASRGASFADLPTQRGIWLRSQDKVRNITQLISQGRYEALDGLDAAGQIKVTKIMGDLKGEFLKRRHLEEGKRAWMNPKHPKYENEIQRINKQVYDGMVRDGTFTKLATKEGDEVKAAIEDWVKHNKEVTRQLNMHRYGVTEFNPETGKGIFGIPFHMDDVYKPKDALKDVEEALGKFKIYKADRLARSNEPIIAAAKQYQKETGKYLDWKTLQHHVDKGDDWAVKLYADARNKTYEIYANKFARNFLDEAEQDAWKFMKEYTDKPLTSGYKTLEGALRGFDKTTNFMKANMLFFSSSWLKNNYFDNMAKSLVENGFQGVVDSATLGKFRKGLNRDIWQLYSHKGIQRAFSKGMREDLRDALARGALDNPMYKALLDRENPLLYAPEKIAKAKEGATKPLEMLEHAGNVWLSNRFMQGIGRIGTQMEGTARFMTYVRVRDAMLNSPVIKSMGEEGQEKARQYAAKVVSETFFDYGDVTHFENAVFKRLIPFYSFYSKNMPYWIKAAFDPEKVGRLIALDKARNNVGKTPDSHDKEGMSKYLTQNAARKLGTDKQGRKRYAIFPSGSMYDAIRQTNPGNWGEEVVAKGHPLLKAPYELISGHDTFDDSELYPSRSKDKKKFLFSRGHKYRMLPGVEVDDQGNPYTTSNGIVTLDKILSTLWPHGMVDQVAGSIGKVASDKETVSEAMFNRFGPAQIAKVTKAYERMIRKQKSGDK